MDFGPLQQTEQSATGRTGEPAPLAPQNKTATIVDHRNMCDGTFSGILLTHYANRSDQQAELTHKRVHNAERIYICTYWCIIQCVSLFYTNPIPFHPIPFHPIPSHSLFRRNRPTLRKPFAYYSGLSRLPLRHRRRHNTKLRSQKRYAFPRALMPLQHKTLLLLFLEVEKNPLDRGLCPLSAVEAG